MAKTPTGGRFVFVCQLVGGGATTCGATTKDEAVILAQRLLIHGLDFEDPFTHNACHWAGNISLTDTEDPDGKNGEAKAILKEAYGNAPVRTFD